jgi:arylsulfatase A-like enzyme
VLIVLALTALAASVGCDGNAEPSATTSDGAEAIIVLHLSGVRADHLGCYGAERSVTPNLDALAAESVRFAWAFSQSGDPAAAQASLLSGLYPTTHQMRGPTTQLPDAVITVAEALADGGYTTAALVDGGFMGLQFGLLQGFDAITDVAGGGLEDLVPETVAWLKRAPQQPFLLWLQTHDAQAPYTPPPEDQARALATRPQAQETMVTTARLGVLPEAPLTEPELATARALYDAELAAVDRHVGTLLTAIEALERPVTVVVVADFGQAFAEHGELTHGSLYTPVTRAPLLIRLAGSDSGSTVEPVVETIDLMPTLLELAGIERPAPVQGASLMPLINGTAQPPHLAFSESASGAQQAVAMAGYRLVHDRTSDQIGLFHLAEDPLETTSLAASDQRRVEVLLRRLDEWRTMVSHASYDPANQQSLDEDTLEQLKGLGYIQ